MPANELGLMGGGNLIFYLIFAIPPMLLAMMAQGMVKSRYATAKTLPARMTGAEAARRILDSAGLTNVQIEQIPGTLSDHYDPRVKVIRLSSDIYNGQTLAAVGIAAHESGHAIQDGTHYSLMTIRNMAVPLASFGGNGGMILIALGAGIGLLKLVLLGVILFSGTFIFQLVNLPVEYNASSRAKEKLVELGIVPEHDMGMVRKVLGAAALTYVAATVSAAAQCIYYLLVAMSRSRRQ